jgi:hypothetical protein
MSCCICKWYAPWHCTAIEHDTATEHGRDSKEAAEKVIDFFVNVMQDYMHHRNPLCAETLVLDTFMACGGKARCATFFDEEVCVRHAELYAMMTEDKMGVSKDFLFLAWAKRCQAIRREVLAYDATTRGIARTRRIATEPATPRTLNETQTGMCYRRMGEEMLKNDLLPHQKQNPAYFPNYDEQGDVWLSSKQRSWVNSMLRRTLGDRKVAFFIWTHGLPEFFARVRHVRAVTCGMTKEMLQSIIEEGMEWYASLIQSLMEHESRSDLDTRRQLSDLRKSPLQDIRRKALQRCNQLKQQGKLLATARDSLKRKFEDMSPTEQIVLEDYETGKTEKHRRAYVVAPDKPFRGELLCKANSAWEMVSLRSLPECSETEQAGA